MIKFAALGALAYAGYRYLQKNAKLGEDKAKLPADAVAGGPLSDKATVQHAPELPAR